MKVPPSHPRHVSHVSFETTMMLGDPSLSTFICIYTYVYTLWLFNIAMEHGPVIGDVHIKMLIIHGYDK
jgi:hypothetical protein